MDICYFPTEQLGDGTPSRATMRERWKRPDSFPRTSFRAGERAGRIWVAVLGGGEEQESKDPGVLAGYFHWDFVEPGYDWPWSFGSDFGGAHGVSPRKRNMARAKADICGGSAFGAYLRAIHVVEQHRKRGLGRLFLQKFEEEGLSAYHAARKNVEKSGPFAGYLLDVDSWNAGAIAFYSDCGYRCLADEREAGMVLWKTTNTNLLPVRGTTNTSREEEE